MVPPPASQGRISGMNILREIAVIQHKSDFSLQRFTVNDAADSGELQAEALVIVETGNLAR